MSRRSLYSSRTQPSVFFGLPDQLKACILDEWLELPNNIREWENRSDLIGAVKASRLFQADLVRLFNSDCVFRCQVKCWTSGQLQWLLANQFRISNIVIDRLAIEEDFRRGQFFAQLAPTLHRLELNLVSSWDIKKSNESEFSYDELSEIGGYEHQGNAHENAAQVEEENQSNKETSQTNQILSELFASFTNLKHFHLCKKVNHANVIIELPDSFSELFTQCVCLESIRLQSCIISTAILQALCRAPRLRRVALLGDTTVALDASVVSGASPVRQVETSSVAFCALFPLLEEVTLTYNDSDDVVSLARACRHVKKAAVKLATPIDASHAHAICMHWVDVSSLTLTSAVRHTKLPLTECAAIVFIEQCPSLRYLYTGCALDPISRCAVTPPCVYPARYKGSQLRELRIKVDWTSDKILNATVVHCPYLHTLHICTVQYNALSSLHLLNNSSVKYLHLKSCEHLSDYSLAPLCTIETLHISDVYGRCKMLTCAGVVNFAKNCPTLRTLHFSNTKPELAMCVLDVMAVCPTLRVFTFDFGQCTTYDTTHQVLIKIIQRMMREHHPSVKVSFVRKPFGYY